MFYSGLTLDRVSDRRTDPAFVAATLSDPAGTVLPLWQDRCLITDAGPSAMPIPAASALLEQAPEPVLLGLDDGAPVFAVDLSGLPEPVAVRLAGADRTADLRTLVAELGEARASLLAYARGILHWHRGQQYCGQCGGRSQPEHGGHLRICDGCGKLLFPRIEPAVIVLVELPGSPRRCLLGRHADSPSNRFSTLAGFVEVGESLEDAVRREVAEEAGVRVGPVRYLASQAWPFPAGLMIAFRAIAESAELRPDGAEVTEARWFTAAELARRIADPALGGPYRLDSIGRYLVESWLAEEAG